MNARPTTTLDLSDPVVSADPYAALAAERAAHAVAWHEGEGRWLTFTHAATSAVLRNRGLGRLWIDHEPAARMEPFNLLHRHQMMENEPPEHTRLRRAVASAFTRGHVERLGPRVEALADRLLDEALTEGRTGGGFDAVAAYAEPLPVLMIADLLGVPAARADDLRAWSQAIVAMYEPAPDEQVRAAAVAAAEEFAAMVAELAAERSRSPQEDLVSDLVADGSLTEQEVIASVVLLLNAGHEASVNALGNGLVTMLAAGGTLADAVGEHSAEAVVEEMLRVDAPLQLFERTATRDVEVGGVVVAQGEKVAALLGAAHRDPTAYADPDVFRPGREGPAHLAFGVGLHHCVGSPLARLELTTALRTLLRRAPHLRLHGEPGRRPGFVLRGYASVPVTAGPAATSG
ncbi:cytochrome P450 [Nocardioidaceae bacterium]|nr:cytochrome P450 [Nocardioidaceae bacterium]